MHKKSSLILIILLVLLIGGIIYLYFSNQGKNTKIAEMTQEFEIQKEELTDEYSQLALQYEGYGLRIGNDSLANLLDAERYKVQQLLDELKMTKASDTRRIIKLRKELETLRGIIKTYVAQIDSLSTLADQLKEENKLVTQQYHKERQQVLSLTEEKNVLTEKVTLAAILEARNIEVETLTSKGKKATRISKMAQLKFSFLIGKNISSARGEKYIYLRIIQPDETPLVKRNENVFMYENNYIYYSCKRPIEYEGEDIPVEIYWDVEEFLHPGEYKVEIFADGYLVGTKTFSLKS